MMESTGNQVDRKYSPLDFEGLRSGRKKAYISLKVRLILELLLQLMTSVV